jgi:hypothetical protein
LQRIKSSCGKRDADWLGYEESAGSGPDYPSVVLIFSFSAQVSWKATKERKSRKDLSRRSNEHEVKQDGLGCSRGSRLAQILFVLSGELPRVMDIIGKMHDFDFVAFI